MTENTDVACERLHDLPFYVNGTVSEAERASIEAHLPGCEHCRAELALLGAVGDALGAAHASPPIASPAHLHAVMARIAAETASARAPARASAMAIMVRWLRSTFEVPGWALAGASAAALALVVGLGVSTPGPAYRTLTSGAGAADVDATVRLVVTPDMTLEAFSSLLDAAGAEIVGGPNSAGAWQVAPRDASVGSLVQRLRASEAVLLAEPLGGEE